MILHNTSSIVIEKEASIRTKSFSKFLLIKRADKPEKGYWAVPGGHVEKGETQYEAAKREAKEEVGNIKIIMKKPAYIFVHDIDLGHRHKAHVFLGKVSGRIKAGTDAKKLGWFTLNQMKNMNLTHYTKKIFNRLFSNKIKDKS